MILLGLLLLGATAAFVGLLIADNLGGGPDYSVTVLGNHIATMSGLAVFLSGIALALIFGMGLIMAAGGARMRRQSALLHGARGRMSATRPEAGVRREATADAKAARKNEGGEPAAPRRHRHRHLFGH